MFQDTLGRFRRASLPGTTLIELLVFLAVLGILWSALLLIPEETSLRKLAHREADRLAYWFSEYFAEASRYRQDLSILLRSNTISQTLPSSVRISWPGGTDTFTLDPSLKFSFDKSQTLISQFSWGSRTVTPAFVLKFSTNKNAGLGESLTVSVRAYITRDCSCGD